jgi:hypothetical protein
MTSHYLFTFSGLVIPCKNYITLQNIYVTDTRLIERHTSLDLALTMCKIEKYNEIFVIDNIGYERSQACLKKILNDRKDQDRETTNDRWTAFQHLTASEYGAMRVTVVACRDKIDAMLFRMEWEH